jgi:MGT family glycosyltransferase
VRYLFCSLDTPGFLFPALAIAGVLRERSHQIAFVSGPNFADAIRQAGFERIPRGPTDGKSFQVQVFAQPLEMVRQVKHIEFALQRFPADVIFGQQMTLGALIAGERFGLPVASLGMMTYLYPRAELPAPGARTRLEQHSAYMHDSMMPLYNTARDVFGLPPSVQAYRDTPLTGDLFMLRSVPELEGDAETLPDNVRFIGDCLWEPPREQPDEELSRWIEDSAAAKQPLLFVQPSKDFSFRDPWPLLVDVLKDRPVRVVAEVRRVGIEQKTFPSNFLVRRFVPLQQVLRGAHAVIANATTTIALGALTHGLPSMLMAAGSEQFSTADRCARVGATVPIPMWTQEAVTAETLGRGVDELLGNPEIRRCAERLQQVFSSVDGHARAADLLEALGRRAAPIAPGDTAEHA